MSKISLPSADALNATQREIYERFPSNLVRGLLLAESNAIAYLNLGASFRKGTLKPFDRELVILRVGGLTRSDYEAMQHKEIALSAGIEQAGVTELLSGGDCPSFDEQHRALIGYVDECVRMFRASASSFERLQAFYTDQEIAQLTLLTGHYWMTAVFLLNLDIPLDDHPTSWDHI